MILTFLLGSTTSSELFLHRWQNERERMREMRQREEWTKRKPYSFLTPSHLHESVMSFLDDTNVKRRKKIKSGVRMSGDSSHDILSSFGLLAGVIIRSRFSRLSYFSPFSPDHHHSTVRLSSPLIWSDTNDPRVRFYFSLLILNSSLLSPILFLVLVRNWREMWKKYKRREKMRSVEKDGLDDYDDDWPFLSFLTFALLLMMMMMLMMIEGASAR